MGLGRKDQKIAAPLPGIWRGSNAALPFEYRHATTTGTTHMNCQLQGGCESREQRVEPGKRRDEGVDRGGSRAQRLPLRQIPR